MLPHLSKSLVFPIKGDKHVAPCKLSSFTSEVDQEIRIVARPCTWPQSSYSYNPKLMSNETQVLGANDI